MSVLIASIRAQIHGQHQAALENLTHMITYGLLTQADTLAAKINDAGIPAESKASANGPHIMTWVVARPATFEAMENALQRLDMQEVGRYIGDHEYEIRFYGIDTALLVIPPTDEAPK